MKTSLKIVFNYCYFILFPLNKVKINSFLKFVFLLSLSNIASAQDVLYLKNKTYIVVKDVKITEKNISYRKYEDTEDIVQLISIAEADSLDYLESGDDLDFSKLKYSGNEKFSYTPYKTPDVDYSEKPEFSVKVKVYLFSPIYEKPDMCNSKQIGSADSAIVSIIKKENSNYYYVKSGNITGYLFVGWIKE